MTAQTPLRTDALVDADWLETHLDDEGLVVVEVDVSPAAHEEGHIPGAVLWNIYSDLKDDGYQPRPMAHIEALLRRSGITDRSTVVFYGYAPALGFWLARYCGVRDVHVLDVSRDRWRASGRPWTSESSPRPPSTFGIDTLAVGMRATRRSIIDAIERGVTILDVRSDLEYEGERFWPSGGIPDGGRVGHIPTAVHLPAAELTGPDGAFLPVADLAEILSHESLTPDRTVITYCTVGARAATVWFALTQLLDFPDVKVYDGSWTEWGMADDTPIALD